MIKNIGIDQIFNKIKFYLILYKIIHVVFIYQLLVMFDHNSLGIVSEAFIPVYLTYDISTLFSYVILIFFTVEFIT